MGNCAACAEQPESGNNRLSELPQKISFTELSQIHYIEQTAGVKNNDKKESTMIKKSIQLKFRIVTKDIFPELYSPNSNKNKEAESALLLDNKPSETKMILYKVSYGEDQIQMWEEEVHRSQEVFRNSALKVIEYDFLAKEVIRVEVARAENRLKLREKPSFDGYVEFNIHDLIRTSKDKSLKLSPIKPMINSNSDHLSNEDKVQNLGYLTLDLREHRKEGHQISSISLSLQGSGFPKSKNLLAFSLYEEIGDNKLKVYQSPLVQRISQYFQFTGVQFKSDVFTTFPIQKAQLKIEVNQEKEPSSFRTLGSAHFVLGDFLKQKENIQLMIRNQDKKLIGKIEVTNFALKPFYSFLDYLSTGLNIVPIVGIDFSLTNITFDNKTVLHTLSNRDLKQLGPNNPYITAIRSICNIHSGLSPHVIPIGLGAKTFPKRSQTSDCFAVNFNIFKPSVTIPTNSKTKQVKKFYDDQDNDQNKQQAIPPSQYMEQCYAQCLRKIQLNAPVHYRQLISLSCDFAEYSMYQMRKLQRNVPKNFYVLYLLTVGLVDDYEDAVKQFVRGIELPLVVVIVKMGTQQIEDIRDVQDVVMRCGSQYQENERKYIDIIYFQDLVQQQNKQSMFTQNSSFAQFSRSLTTAINNNVNIVTQSSSSIQMDGIISKSFLQQDQAKPRIRSETVSNITTKLLSQKNEQQALSKQLSKNLAHQIQEYMNGRQITPNNQSKTKDQGEQAKKRNNKNISQVQQEYDDDDQDNNIQVSGQVWNHLEQQFWSKVSENIGMTNSIALRKKISQTGLPQASLQVLKIIADPGDEIVERIGSIFSKESDQSGGSSSYRGRVVQQRAGRMSSSFSESQDEQIKKGDLPKTPSQLKLQEQIRQMSTEFDQIDGGGSYIVERRSNNNREKQRIGGEEVMDYLNDVLTMALRYRKSREQGDGEEEDQEQAVF